MTEHSHSARSAAVHEVLDLTPKPTAFDRQRIRARIESIVERGTFSDTVQRVDRAMTQRAILAARMGHISAKVWIALWLAPTFLLGFGSGVLWSPRPAPVVVPQAVSAPPAAPVPTAPAATDQQVFLAAPAHHGAHKAASHLQADKSAQARSHQRQAQLPAATAGAEPASTPVAEPAAASARHQLGEELRLMRAASAALEAQDFAGVRRALAEHEQRFAQGALAHERNALRLISLCRQGARHDDVAAFLAAHPASPLVAGVREACAVQR